MSLRCPKCGREYDVTLFQYRRTVACPCGEELSLENGHTVRDSEDDGKKYRTGIDWEALEREIFKTAAERNREYDKERAADFRREADRIVSLILYSDMPRVDIEIAIRTFRDRILASFPEREALFNALYLSRFRRLWNQFRDDDDQLLP
jgi:uncharacterized Zn finger protein (UPF0148 family)